MATSQLPQLQIPAQSPSLYQTYSTSPVELQSNFYAQAQQQQNQFGGALLGSTSPSWPTSPQLHQQQNVSSSNMSYIGNVVRPTPQYANHAATYQPSSFAPGSSMMMVSASSASSSTPTGDAISRESNYFGTHMYQVPQQQNHLTSQPPYSNGYHSPSSTAPPLSPMTPFHSQFSHHPSTLNPYQQYQSAPLSPGLHRGRLGHATTPSFHPNHSNLRPPSAGASRGGFQEMMNRRGSMASKHIQMKSHARVGSIGPGTLSAGKKKTVHVRVPKEIGDSDDSELGEDAGAEEDESGGEPKPKLKKRSGFIRYPLQGEAKRRRCVETDLVDVELEADEIVSRLIHFDEVKFFGLPPTIEIYLPGREAWDEVREQLGVSLFLGSIPSALSASPNQQHQRASSLFGGPSSFPPRLQSAIDSITRHASAQSVAGPLARSFTIPQWAGRVLDQFERGLVPPALLESNRILPAPESTQGANSDAPSKKRPIPAFGDPIEEDEESAQGGSPEKRDRLPSKVGDEKAPHTPPSNRRSTSITTPRGSRAIRLSIDTDLDSAKKNSGTIIFEAPSEIDQTPQPTSPIKDSVSNIAVGPHATPHRVTQNFEFPPRSIPPQRVSPLKQPPSFDATAEVSPSGSKRKYELNVAAPEFVFGGATSTTTFASLARDTRSENKIKFGPFGSPGSLAADTLTTESRPHSPAPLAAAPTLNPLVGEFKPTFGAVDFGVRKFEFKAPSNAPSITLPRVPPRTFSTSEVYPVVTIGGQGYHRPLPPVPLTSVIQSTYGKRAKLDNGDYSLAPHPTQLDLRSPLPRNPTIDEVAQDQLIDGGEMSPSPIGQAGQRHSASLSDLTKLPPLQRTTQRPFTLRSSPSSSSDAKRLDFKQRRVSSGATEKPRSRPPLVSSRSNSFDDGRRDRQESVDVEIPNDSRPWGKAIPIIQPVVEGSVFTEVVESIDDESEMGSVVSHGSSIMPLTTDSGDEPNNTHEGESPLEILENLLAGYFEALSADLNDTISKRAVLETKDRSELLDGLVGRVVNSILDARVVGVEIVEQQLMQIRKAVQEGQLETKASLETLLKDWVGEHQPPVKNGDSSELVVRDESNSELLVTPASISKLRDEIVASISHLLQEKRQLDDRATPTKGGTSQEIIKAVEMATQPLHKAFAASGRTESISEHPSLSSETASIAQHIADKVESSAAQLKQLASALEDLKNNVTTSADVHALSTAVENGQNLTTSPVTPSLPQSDPSLALAHLDASVISAQVAHDLQARLDNFAQELKVAVIASSFDIDALVGRIGNETRSAQPRDVWSTSLEVLVNAHQKLERTGSELGSNQQSLNIAIGALESTLNQKLERLGQMVENQVKDVVFNSESIANVAELELQLAKARSDYGKVRSEKASMTERFELERNQRVGQIDSLKEEIERRNEAEKVLDEEKLLLIGAIDRLEHALTSSTTHSAQLETALAAITLRQDSERVDKEGQQEAINAVQAELDRAKADGELSSKEVQLLIAENARTASELAELRIAHERLSNQKHEDDLARANERDAASRAVGEISALEKRITVQDDKIASLQLLKSKQQQALAQANQRAVDLKKKAGEVDTANERIAELVASNTTLEERLSASEAVRELLVQESTDSRRQTELGLEEVRDTIVRELGDKDAKIKALEAERDDLSQECERLDSLTIELSEALRRGSMRSTAPTPKSAETPRPHSGLSVASNAYPSPENLQPQRTGGSNASLDTLHREQARHYSSPTPSSLASRALVVDDLGWWSAE